MCDKQYIPRDRKLFIFNVIESTYVMKWSRVLIYEVHLSGANKNLVFAL